MTAPFEAHLTSYLQNATSNDKAVREQAEAGIRQFEEANWPAFITGLAQEIANEGSQEFTRQMAGLLLKNALDAKDSHLQVEKTQKWKSLDGSPKATIRTALLQTLASKVVSAAHGAAMAIAKVARIELLEGVWPELLPRLHQFVAPDSPEQTRVYALQCLGYICEEHVDAADTFPQLETNKILTSMVQGMAGNQPTEVRLAATKALCDALEFATMNFEKQEERDYLMQMICEATISPDARIRLAAYQNLNKVVDLHYKYLEAYIQTIYQLTTQSFSDAEEDVAMQAIEFWSTLAEIEFCLKEDEETNGVSSGDSECKRFLERCAGELVPLLLNLLTLQEENQDEDDNEWNKCMCATVCLINIAQCVRDQIVEVCKAYIQVNVSKRAGPEDWRAREAAMTCFGCIVDGPDRNKLLPFVQEAFAFLISHGLQDPHPMVRRTTLWTLGRIFQYLHSPHEQPPLVTQHNVRGIVEALLAAMQGGHSMAQKACYAIQQLAAGFASDDEKHELSPFFATLVDALLKVAYADVPLEHAVQLHVTAFETMHTVIQRSAQESIELVTQMVPHLLQRINETFAMPVAGMNDEATKSVLQRRNELQGQLCAALQVTIKRASAHPAAKQVLLNQHADAIMEALLKVQASRQAVHEEVIMAMSVLCIYQGPGFHRYLPHVMPHVMAGLTRHEDWQVCRVCINAMGDIAREVTSHLAPYADQIMTQLLANLQSENLNREVKPDILAVFGDMAQGLGVGFDRYMQQVVETLQAAMNIAYTNQLAYQDEEDPDESMVIYNNELRGGIVQAAAGILSFIPDDPAHIPQMCSQLLTPFGRNLVRFISLIHQDHEFADESLRKEAVGLLGDLCRIPGMAGEVAAQQNKAWIAAFMKANQDLPRTSLAYTEDQLRRAGVV